MKHLDKIKEVLVEYNNIKESQKKKALYGSEALEGKGNFNRKETAR